jgi:hypothetical protein
MVRPLMFFGRLGAVDEPILFRRYHFSLPEVARE